MTKEERKQENDAEEVLVVVPATPIFQTTVRQKITPYLPPPVVVAMKRIDPQLEPYIGPEPSINIMGTFVLALLLWQFMKVVSNSVSGGGSGGKAIQGDTNDPSNDVLKSATTSNKHYDETILLCGPSFGGKTSLFYTLLLSSQQGSNTHKACIPKTVKSLQPNSGYLESKNNDKGKTRMILDLPGLWDTTKVVSTIQETCKTVSSSQPIWIVVVLDSTQPVSKVADYLYQILSSSSSSALDNNNSNVNVIIACHKSKATKAKNVRRIKIQLRTELERLTKLQQPKQDNDQDADDKADADDWEAILNDQTKLVPTSSDPPALEEFWKELQQT